MSYPRVQIKRRPVKTSTVVNGLLHGEMGYIDDVNELYIGAYDDETMPAKLLNVKNTAGALNKSGLLYLVGAPVQSNNPTTFSNFQVFIDENDKLNAPNYVATDNHDKINFDGNAATAEKWRTPVSLSVTGLATGSVTFDGATKSLTLNLGESSGLTGAYLKDVIEDRKNSAETSGLMPNTDANTVDNRFVLVLGNGSYKSAIKIIRSISSLWTNGNAAGPVLSITLNGMVHKIAAIPSATASISGVVTTGAQTFGGTKTFANDVNVSGNESVSGTLNVTSDISGGKTLTVASTATVNGATNLKGTLTVTGVSTLNNALKVTGVATFSNGTDSTASNNGAVVVTGGVGIGKQLRVGGATTLTGALTANGATTVNNTLTATGIAKVTNNTEATATNNGALIVSGGVGIAKNLYVGGALSLTGNLNVTGDINGGKTLTVASTANINGILYAKNSTDSTATNNGGTIISGGLGVAKQIRAGGNVTAPTFIGALSGNAATATTLQTSRTIAISGAVTGTATDFNGGSNITIPTTAIDVSKANAGTLPIARGGTGVTNADSILTSVSWSAGTTSGPTVNVVVLGQTRSAAIPVASTTVSGVITTGAQKLLGVKTFQNNIVGHNTLLHYQTTAQNSGYYKISINSTARWMLAFTVRVYQNYRYYDITFSGYNNATSYWYQPKAVLSSDSSLSNTTVYFGYDSANYLWVAIPAQQYTAIDIISLTNGWVTITDYSTLFTIANVSSLSGTIQSTQTIYSPLNRNEIKIGGGSSGCVFPVGYVFMTTTYYTTASLGTLLGGTWEFWSTAAGRFLRCAPSNASGYTNSIGGNSNVTSSGPSITNTGWPSTTYTGSTTLTISQIPSHTHAITEHIGLSGVQPGSSYIAEQTNPNVPAPDWHTEPTGGGESHNHTLNNHTHSLNSHTHSVPASTPSYIYIYMYRRIS